MKSWLNIQLLTAFVLAFGGLVMLFCGIYISPLGEIHESLLVAFGEVATFAGALFGIDYTYKAKTYDNKPGSPNNRRQSRIRPINNSVPERADTDIPDPGE